MRNVAILELLYCTGIRIGELSSIDTHDLLQDSATLLIHGKGRKERLLYISSAEVMEAVNAWLRVRNQLKPQDAALFLNRYGGRLSIFGLEDIFATALKNAGIAIVRGAGPTHEISFENTHDWKNEGKKSASKT